MRPYEIVLSVPHASVDIPEEIRSLMPHSDEVLKHEPDLYTDRIYDVKGVRAVQAQVNRIISDVNRAPDEIYTEGERRAEGVVSLSLSHGQDSFREDPDLETMQNWINTFHTPFHEELDRALNGARFLIDCHSMWSVAPPSRPDAGTVRPDVTLGNRLYTTCDAHTTKFLRDYWEGLGYEVSVNRPYIGRYVVGTHCSRKGIPGIQIEFSRALYMDERSLEPRAQDIEKLNREFGGMIAAFCAWDEARPKREKVHMCDLSGRGEPQQ